MEENIVPFKEEYINSAVHLFTNNYQKAQAENGLLPHRVMDEPEWIIDALKTKVNNPGVAVFQQGKFVAYMITGYHFTFKGQKTASIPEYCHGSIEENKKHLYHRMYMELAGFWIKSNIHLHIIGHLSYDRALKEILFELGFGAILKEQLKELSSIPGVPEIEIIEEKNVENLLPVAIEHNHYYTKSPIFIRKNTDRDNVLDDLRKHAARGDAILVYYENKKPCAYFIVGESEDKEGEGFLLRKTNTAQIRSAYAVPACRGKGIGKALLQYAINRAKKHGYERLFVEHESANYYGGTFWNRHFVPYLYVSMRYIDNTITSSPSTPQDL
ncbi:MAG: GNAT family N-acetyltransferase [Spirochaetales bacterium]|nr:GNAT family N-acetyltransferase [Spirochaetales bacterium]